MFVDANGIKMAYSDTGEGSPVVLLVHAFPLNRSMWDPQAEVVRAAGARAIAPDLRGFGASEAGPPGPLSMDQHADDLAGLLDVLRIDDQVVYVGLSMGGYIAFAFWRRHSSRVRALVLADTRAGEDAPSGRQDRLNMAARAQEQNSPQPAIDGMLPRMLSPQLRAGSLPEHLVRGMMASTSAGTIADAQRGMAARPSSLETLATINVPTLVIVGEHDVLTPVSESRVIAEAIPGAHLATIDQAGHISNLENPEAFNELLLAFLHGL
jgi:pimeloyl-ACP methyl ester carboxylesterase